MNYFFKPLWWMSHPHAQTVLPRFFRPLQQLPVVFEELCTPDNDFLELVWAPVQNDQRSPLVVVLHGLEGNINSFYAKGMLSSLFNHGFDSVLLHFRNCSRRPNRLARSYHSGDTQDLRLLLQKLRQRFPKRPLYAVGFSLGGNVLAKYLGEQREQSFLEGAIAISAPYHLSSSCQVIQNSFGQMYQKYLLDRLKRSLLRKLSIVQRQLTLSKKELYGIKSLWQFDEQITAPLHGFSGAEDYYDQASAQSYLSKITTPTLLIHAKDDPMLSSCSIPLQEQVSDAVTLAVSEQGGHVGFISGEKGRPQFWLEQVVPDYFRMLLSEGK